MSIFSFNDSFLQFFGLEGIGPTAVEVKKVLGDCVEVDSLSSHEIWSHGSACIRGTNLAKTEEYCMQQVKLPSLNETRENDGLFAMIDGGKVPDASSRIKKKIASIVHAELLAACIVIAIDNWKRSAAPANILYASSVTIGNDTIVKVTSYK